MSTKALFKEDTRWITNISSEFPTPIIDSAVTGLAKKRKEGQFIIVDLTEGPNYAGVYTHPVSGLAFVFTSITEAYLYAEQVAELPDFRVVNVG